MIGNFSFPTDIRVGGGRINEIAAACRAHGISSALLVTDRNLAGGEVVGAVERVLRGGGIDCAVFAGVQSDPGEEAVKAGVAACAGCDGVVAVGGGSAMDAGKAIAFMRAQDAPIWEFEDKGDLWRSAKTDGILPIIAAPTTAGTGSEAGRAAVISRADGEKKVIFHPQMLPRVAVLDPNLTVGLPPPLTAATGFDAFAHAWEAFCAPAYHPLCDGVALGALRLVNDALPRAVADGGDLAARTDMLVAAAMGAIAFQKGLGAVHALSHPLGAIYHKHHGLLNAVLLPYIVAHNRAAVADKLAAAARLLNLRPANGGGIIRRLLDLRRATGVPHTLAELGIDDSRADDIAAMALRDPTAAGNPIPLTAAACRDLLKRAIDGDIAAD